MGGAVVVGTGVGAVVIPTLVAVVVIPVTAVGPTAVVTVVVSVNWGGWLPGATADVIALGVVVSVLTVGISATLAPSVA
jgi:hypothetical protein